jgi:Fe-S cluster biogenesis protein NfuA
MAAEVDMLPTGIQTALLEVVSRFNQAGIVYEVGGSVMLRLAGLDVPVGDVDIVVGADSRADIVASISDRQLEEPTSRDPWRTAWFMRTGWPVDDVEVGVDIMGGLALVIDGELAQFPVGMGTTAIVGGITIPLGSLPHWYHLYRVHDPTKAALLAARLTDAEILAAAADLQISQVFSPTLIVRIGNGAEAEEIETTMSSDVQSSIIEVASPTDQTFDEPGTEIIDRALLEETLEYIRPALQADGGDLILLGTTGGKVTLQMVGACGGCPLSTMTLTAGIERILQDRVPGVTEVVSL